MINKDYSKIPKFLIGPLDRYTTFNAGNILITKTRNIFNIKSHSKIGLCINLEKTNNILHINTFHESVNMAVKYGGIYCSCAETNEQRKSRKWEKYNFLLSPIMLFIDFIYKRVIPKLPITKHIYFAMTRGHNRVMSKAEILGRLSSCGFDVLEVVESQNISYIISKKVRTPYYDMHPSYGPIFKMKRVGFKGNIISVYKFRTMSPYSEYVQKQIIEKNRLDEGGKIKDDYRITFYGKFFRKYWIDELPMIINWMKGELKMVGVRPLSEDYFFRYPKDLQELRIKTRISFGTLIALLLLIA